MVDLSRIDEIVDASAAIAGAYIPGLAMAYGIGSDKIAFQTAKDWNNTTGLWVDRVPQPAYVGNKVQAFSSNPNAPMVHVSDMPDAPVVKGYSAGVTEIMWRVPMRLYVSKGDQSNARRLCAPFYARYLIAFEKHAMLYGTANSCEITHFDLFHDVDTTGYVGIAMLLSVWERLDMEFEVGITPYHA